MCWGGGGGGSFPLLLQLLSGCFRKGADIIRTQILEHMPLSYWPMSVFFYLAFLLDTILCEVVTSELHRQKHGTGSGCCYY